MERNKRCVVMDNQPQIAGITLIALVVTIIVLLILAGITISLVIGQNGIITRATSAKESQRIAKIQEEINLAWGDTEIKDKTNTMTIEEVRQYFEGELKKEDSTATVTYNETTKQFEVHYKEYDTTIEYEGTTAVGDWKEAYAFHNYILGVTNTDELILVPSKTGWSNLTEVLDIADTILEEKIKVSQIELIEDGYQKVSYGIIDKEGNLWIYESNNDGLEPMLQKITNINKKIVKIVASYSSCYVIDEEGSLWTWGANEYGQLGDGTTIPRSTPQKITSINKKIVKIVATYGSCYAIDEEGSLWSWGENDYGQIGDKTTINRSTPQKITTIDKKIVQIYEKDDSVYAIDEEGNLWSWGRNSYGQLGDGTTVNRSTPQKIMAIDKEIVQVYGSYGCRYVLDREGSLWSWGLNSSGELGDGTTVNRSTPQKIALLDKKVEQFVVGESVCYAIDKEGSLWSWGSNTHGQVGNGTDKDATTPQKITTIDKRVVEVRAGKDYTRDCFVTDEQKNIWSWGYNHYEQLGGGAGGNIPVKVRQNSKVFNIGIYYSIFRYEEGKIIVNGSPNPEEE